MPLIEPLPRPIDVASPLEPGGARGGIGNKSVCGCCVEEERRRTKAVLVEADEAELVGVGVGVGAARLVVVAEAPARAVAVGARVLLLLQAGRVKEKPGNISFLLFIQILHLSSSKFIYSHPGLTL